jgi:hypothetical protein
MKTKILFITISLYLHGIIVTAQTQVSEDLELDKAIKESGFIHTLLPVKSPKSFEAAAEKKEILYAEPLCELREGLPGWQHIGLGTMAFSKDMTLSGKGSIRVEYPAKSYTDEIKSFVDFLVNGENWERFNRVSFWVYPDCEGARIVHMSLLLHNDGKVKIPYDYNREGAHYINLVNKEWNHVLLEIDENGRDKVSRFAFSFPAFGQERTMSDIMCYYVDKIELQKIKLPEKTVGWEPADNRVVYSTTGYAVNSEKTAIVNMAQNLHNNKFQLINAQNNHTVFYGEIKHVKTTIGEFDVLDFSTFTQVGDYQLEVGNVLTPAFRISERIWENSLWRVTNYFFGERCGFDVPNKHTTCHTDIFAEHNGKRVMYAGGWHDAGDQAQQTLQTGEIAYTLLEAYTKMKNKNEQLALRMLEEARWGLEFTLRCRFGDGYRASGVGNIEWTDGLVGTADDKAKARVIKATFDNFVYSAIEAYAAIELDHDPNMQDYLAKIAKEDFEFAMVDHKVTGYVIPHGGGHTLNTPESQYMATISWAASMLYKLTQESYYANIAAEYIKYTLDCQRKEPLGKQSHMAGFFYRDKTRHGAVHYNHQSRDQMYMQAMTLLCETQPGHPDYAEWAESIWLYGQYLKSIMPYTAPYGMIASGIYRLDEMNDPYFEAMHTRSSTDELKNYTEQVKNGVQLDKEHYLKRFPVWFSFRGNAAVHLATGKAAALCGKFLNDKELLQIGQEQLYWLVGKNPFGQSMIYGEGHNYAQQFAVCPGELVGEVPVGVQTRFNGDEPSWPYTNNSTYKEVWGSSAGKWISLAIEY